MLLRERCEGTPGELRTWGANLERDGTVPPKHHDFEAMQ